MGAFLNGRWVLAESPWFWPWDLLLLAPLYAWEWVCSQALGEFACGARQKSKQGWVVALPLLLDPLGILLNLCSLICEMGILEVISDKVLRI